MNQTRARMFMRELLQYKGSLLTYQHTYQQHTYPFTEMSIFGIFGITGINSRRNSILNTSQKC